MIRERELVTRGLPAGSLDTVRIHLPLEYVNVAATAKEVSFMMVDFPSPSFSKPARYGVTAWEAVKWASEPLTYMSLSFSSTTTRKMMSFPLYKIAVTINEIGLPTQPINMAKTAGSFTS